MKNDTSEIIKIMIDDCGLSQAEIAKRTGFI